MAEHPPLVDAAVRERIVTDLDATLFVEASAGTGKTSSLVARLVHLVTSGAARLSEVAAITFTELAAAELRDRVREALERADHADALADLDDAAICTIHAFAQRILGEHPLEAGLPPQFEVVDELQAAAAFERRWERFLAGLLASPDAEDVLRAAFTMGLQVRHLRDLAVEMHAHYDRLAGAPLEAGPVPVPSPVPVLAALDDAFAEAAAAECPDGLAEHLDGLRPFVQRLGEAAPADVLATLVNAPTLTCRYGPASVRDPLKAAEGARQAALAEVGAAVVTALAERIRRFTLESAAARREEGRLEFHDLLVLARDLVRDRPDVRAAARARWTRLLVDEFQDTDPLQAELAVLLATGDGGLFVVGDPKQSIYRFRRADIALYDRTRRELAQDVLRLESNFRSAAPIVEWVNTVFPAFLTQDDEGLQAAYSPLAATVPGEGAARVQVVGGPDPRPVSEIRAQEAADLVAVVERAKAEGWPVRDDAPPGTRPARYQDVAVLLPTRLLLPQLERALSAAGVPYRVESRSLLYATQEVRDLLNVLRAADDPTDEVALVAALRSPAYACPDDALLDFRARGGRWNHLAAPPEGLDLTHPVAAALAHLRDLHERRAWQPVHALVEAVLRECRFFEIQMAHPRPRDHWRRLRFVLDQARTFAESGPATLRAFLDWADRQADEGARVNEAIVPEPDDDAVRILTVHAAKGLEFPVVVLAGLNTTPPNRRPRLLFGDDGVEITLGSKGLHVATPHYEARHARERAAEDAERLRLLYVAATRARDHLVVSLHHKENAHSSLAARLLAQVREHGPEPVVAAAAGAAPAVAPAPAAAAVTASTPPTGEADAETWEAARADLLERLGRLPVLAATSVGGPADDEPPETPPWRRGRAGTSMGRAVHAVLQSIDLATGAGLEEVAAAQAAAEGVSDRTDEVAALARAALGSAAVKEAVASGRFWREVYVAAPVEGTLLEGFVDLLYETPAGLVVVDYKTDAPAPEGEGGAPGAEVSERYRLQGATYAAVLREALGRPVARCVFVFVGSGHADERTVTDLTLPPLAATN